MSWQIVESIYAMKEPYMLVSTHDGTVSYGHRSCSELFSDIEEKGVAGISQSYLNSIPWWNVIVESKTTLDKLYYDNPHLFL